LQVFRIERSTALSTPRVARKPAVGRFAALKPGGREAVFADDEVAHVTEPSVHKVQGALAASARCTTAPGDGSAARTPDGLVALFANNAAVHVEGVAALDTTNEKTAASALSRVYYAM